MVGRLGAAFARNGEVEVGLNQARADCARGRFNGVGEQTRVFRHGNDHVLALCCRRKLQRCLKLAQTIAVGEEVVRASATVGLNPLCCRERGESSMSRTVVSAQRGTGRVFEHAAMQGGVEPQMFT